ncbi:hypothetical protein [Rhizobium sp. NPDC090279]
MIRLICRRAAFGRHLAETADTDTPLAAEPHSLGGDHADTAQ